MIAITKMARKESSTCMKLQQISPDRQKFKFLLLTYLFSRARDLESVDGNILLIMSVLSKRRRELRSELTLIEKQVRESLENHRIVFKSSKAFQQTEILISFLKQENVSDSTCIIIFFRIFKASVQSSRAGSSPGYIAGFDMLLL